MPAILTIPVKSVKEHRERTESGVSQHVCLIHLSLQHKSLQYIIDVFTIHITFSLDRAKQASTITPLFFAEALFQLSIAAADGDIHVETGISALKLLFVFISPQRVLQG